MANDVHGVKSELLQIAEDARAKFGGLSETQLNWKPSPTAWSVGQCLEHLIVSDKLFDEQFEKIRSGTRRNSFWETWSPFSGWAGRFLAKTLKDDGKKTKTISKMSPPSEVGSDIVDRFLAHEKELADTVDSIAGDDWERTVITSPFFGLITYRVTDGLLSVLEHHKRHLRQAERVIQTEGFPG